MFHVKFFHKKCRPDVNINQIESSSKLGVGKYLGVVRHITKGHVGANFAKIFS